MPGATRTQQIPVSFSQALQPEGLSRKHEEGYGFSIDKAAGEARALEPRDAG